MATNTTAVSSTNEVFKTLSAISIKDKIERKGNLDYLSWANAWSLLKTHYPNAQRKIYEHEHTGLNYFTDGTTAYVKVGIVVNDIEHIDYLPVMDFRNNAIPIGKLTSMDVNKTIQRSTAKAIAMHGLGLSLWTGEDVPELTTTPPVVSAPTIELEELKKDSAGWAKVCSYIEANKSLGIEAIGKQLSRKYKMSPAIKKEIANLVNS
tara:strand:+ start:1146 stop:1766 length:621 start_codon:yes stop_codon:yes gene_type:complete